MRLINSAHWIEAAVILSVRGLPCGTPNGSSEGLAQLCEHHTNESWGSQLGHEAPGIYSEILRGLLCVDSPDGHRNLRRSSEVNVVPAVFLGVSYS